MAVAFKPGPIKRAGVIVLSCDDPVNTRTDTRYTIRYTCCGREASVVHRTIVRRLLDGLDLCRVCSAARGPGYSEEEESRVMEEKREREEFLASLAEPKLPYGFVVPPWPRPSFSVPMFLREREYYNNQC